MAKTSSKISLDSEALTGELVEGFLLIAMARAREVIPSETLKRGLHYAITGPETGYLEVPHYWAVYVHDGHGPVGGDQVVVWFIPPELDPRIPNGNPERLAEKRSLTASEIAFGLELNRHARRGGVPPNRWPMQVHSGTKKGVSGSYFFTDGMAGLMAEYDEFAARVVDKHLKAAAQALFKSIKKPDRAHVRF